MMAKENKEVEAVAAATYAIEELQERNKTPAASFEGAKSMHGWKPGRQLTESEYTKAVEGFMKAPAGRRPRC